MARPQIKIDEVMLEKLTKLHLSDKVIADVLGCSVDTLHRRFADKMDVWRSKSVSKIADVLFDEAVNKREPWALKELVKKHLGYSGDDQKPVNVTNNIIVDKVDLDERVKQLKGEE